MVQELAALFSVWGRNRKPNSGYLKANGSWKTKPVYIGTWLRGLYDAEMMVQFLADPRVGQVSFYNFSDAYFQTAHQAYWVAGNAPAGSSQNGNYVYTNNAEAGGLTAIGQAYNLVDRAIAGAKVAYQTSFPGLPSVKVTPPNGGDSSSYLAVTGVWLEKEAVDPYHQDNDPLFFNTRESGTWLILNLSSEQQKLPDFDRGLGTIESLWSPSLVTIVIPIHPWITRFPSLVVCPSSISHRIRST